MKIKLSPVTRQLLSGVEILSNPPGGMSPQDRLLHAALVTVVYAKANQCSWSVAEASATAIASVIGLERYDKWSEEVNHNLDLVP